VEAQAFRRAKNARHSMGALALESRAVEGQGFLALSAGEGAHILGYLPSIRLDLEAICSVLIRLDMS
jgi:hypothetical protein